MKYEQLVILSNNRIKEMNKPLSKRQNDDTLSNIKNDILNPLYNWLDSLYPTDEQLKKYASTTGKFKYIVFASKGGKIMTGDDAIYIFNVPEFKNKNIIFVPSNDLKYQYTHFKNILYNDKHIPICQYNNIATVISLRHVCEYLVNQYKNNDIKVIFEKKSIGCIKSYIVYISWDIKKLSTKECKYIHNKI